MDLSGRETQTSDGTNEIDVRRTLQGLNESNPLLNDVVAGRSGFTNGVEPCRVQHAFDGHGFAVTEILRRED